MLPSGTIKMSEVRAELKTTGSINLGRTDVRNLAGKATGIIKMSDLKGKSKALFSGQLTIGYMNKMNIVYVYGYEAVTKKNPVQYGDLNPKTLFGGTITAIYIIGILFYILITSAKSNPKKIKVNIANEPTIYVTNIGNDGNEAIYFMLEEDNKLTGDELSKFFISNNGKTIPVTIDEIK